MKKLFSLFLIFASLSSVGQYRTPLAVASFPVPSNLTAYSFMYQSGDEIKVWSHDANAWVTAFGSLYSTKATLGDSAAAIRAYSTTIKAALIDTAAALRGSFPGTPTISQVFTASNLGESFYFDRPGDEGLMQIYNANEAYVQTAPSGLLFDQGSEIAPANIEFRGTNRSAAIIPQMAAGDVALYLPNTGRAKDTAATLWDVRNVAGAEVDPLSIHGNSTGATGITMHGYPFNFNGDSASFEIDPTSGDITAKISTTGESFFKVANIVGSGNFMRIDPPNNIYIFGPEDFGNNTSIGIDDYYHNVIFGANYALLAVGGGNYDTAATRAYARSLGGGPGGTPAGNYGNVQLNRNGVFVGTDSLNFTASYGLGITGNLTVTNFITAGNWIGAGNYLQLNELASLGGTPASGKGAIFEKTDGKVYFMNDDGTEYNLTAGGTPTLQQVTDAGWITTNAINTGGLTVTYSGTNIAEFGADVAMQYGGHLALKSRSSAYRTFIHAGDLTGNWDLFLPNKNGTLATTDDINGGAGTYKEYAALITQVSGDPTVDVLHNDLSGPIVWTRSSAGTYWGTLTGAFGSTYPGKVVGFVQVGPAYAAQLGFRWYSADQVEIYSAYNGTPADNAMDHCSLVIRVYN